MVVAGEVASTTVLAEMAEVASVSPALSGPAAQRADRALALRRNAGPQDVAALRAEVQHLLSREA